MAIDFISLGITKNAQELRGALEMLNRGRDQLTRVFATMGHCTNGSDYTTLETVFGLSGQGQALFDETNSFVSKLNTDSSVTNLNAAWNQISAKLGIV